MPNILTGNRLETGDVLYWDGADWSTRIADAAEIGAEGEPLLARLIAEERINDPVLIPVTGSAGNWMPTTTRERVRASGPSVRADLARGSLSVEAI
ncbi:DUF2849 domain-containing protein [Polymorphobacter fuscus]|uniref:DUF2849 domain-containing protein n=1 Tax=Sandarakinorhabdus fusca TaxID=1439888 RepID=A0A7C9GWY8_9SPHN|nr:DUF2849 domain-containing protein [Polymorphobacter fuscus]KAB7647587.1 DUF2849 domain-containing protein [Polymorphobacter fuscus]MQT16854.1 DUF2849 domain-containing protein [Polymorphobacter fuscus]NJC09157.1 hypothetical protein [Polymorphobacter fuscus]